MNVTWSKQNVFLIEPSISGIAPPAPRPPSYVKVLTPVPQNVSYWETESSET